MVMEGPLLETKDLRVWFSVRRGRGVGAGKGMVRAVDGVSLRVAGGETLGLVGESGCGKSTLARAVVLLEKPVSGEVLFEGRALRGLDARALRRVRPRMQMVFQDPYASLNPRMTVADALAEPMIVHGTVPRAEVPAAVAGLMERVGLARRAMRKYPHEFSGGQRQRIAIARALATEPRLMIADEPVSALDVSVQAQIINLLRELQAEMGLAMLFISHDLSVVRHLSQRIAVMYLGRIVEEGSADALFAQPRHPYTRALLSAAMTPDPRRERTRMRIPLPGEPSSPIDPPSGCRFHPRCPMAGPECALREPEAEPCGDNHRAWCMRLK
jgi:oligopeptide transport system ATP-binding protein